MNKTAIILFGKYPREGHVKTRLAATIGHTAATELYRRCLRHIFNECAVFDSEIFYFCYSEKSDEEDVRKITPSHILAFPQIQDSLPARIQEAFRHVYDLGHSNVVIFSTDVPNFNSTTVKNALQQLNTHEAVIGRDSDGGYYALGMNRYLPNILDVDYGGTVGMHIQTMARAKELGLHIGEIEPQIDVDTIEDLKKFAGDSPDAWQKYFNYDGYFTDYILY